MTAISSTRILTASTIDPALFAQLQSEAAASASAVTAANVAAMGNGNPVLLARDLLADRVRDSSTQPILCYYPIELNWPGRKPREQLVLTQEGYGILTELDQQKVATTMPDESLLWRLTGGVLGSVKSIPTTRLSEQYSFAPLTETSNHPALDALNPDKLVRDLSKLFANDPPRWRRAMKLPGEHASSYGNYEFGKSTYSYKVA